MGIPLYVVEHLRGAMADYQTGHMSRADNNVYFIDWWWQQNAALALPPRKGWLSCETGQ